jgi:chromosome partitioning protein
MFIVAMIGQKGGTGKTTAAIGLAVEAARTGVDVVLIDFDQQATAANWKDRRKKDDLVVTSIQPSRLEQTLVLCAENGAGLVIIDTPGKSTDVSVKACRAANLVLIPAKEQIFESETLEAVRDILRLAGDPPAYVLVNRVHPQATKSADAVKQLIAEKSGLRVCPIHLSRRDIFEQAPATGHSAQEIDSDSAASRELSALYKFTSQHVNISKGVCEQKESRKPR